MKNNQKEGCRRFDIFGHQISLNYRGSSQYRTCFGAVVTTALMLVMLLVLAIKVNLIVLNENDDGLSKVKVSQLTTFNDQMIIDGFQLNKQQNFAVYIGIQSSNETILSSLPSEYLISPRYG